MGLHLVLLSFILIYLGWVCCFYFCKITSFITGNAPLILKIFNNKTDIIMFLIRMTLLSQKKILYVQYMICQALIY